MSQVKLSNAAKQILKSPIFWGMTAPPLIGTAIAAAGAGIHNMRESRGKAKAYQEMIRENPSLKNFDAKRTKAYFNSMYGVSPDLAKDPHVAGAWVHNVLDNQDPHDNRPNYALLSAVTNLAGPGRQLHGAKVDRQRSSLEAEMASGLAMGVARAGDTFAGEYRRAHDKSQTDAAFARGEREGRRMAQQEMEIRRAQREAGGLLP